MIKPKRRPFIPSKASPKQLDEQIKKVMKKKTQPVKKVMDSTALKNLSYLRKEMKQLLKLDEPTYKAWMKEEQISKRALGMTDVEHYYYMKAKVTAARQFKAEVEERKKSGGFINKIQYPDYFEDYLEGFTGLTMTTNGVTEPIVDTGVRFTPRAPGIEFFTLPRIDKAEFSKKQYDVEGFKNYKILKALELADTKYTKDAAKTYKNNFLAAFENLNATTDKQMKRVKYILNDMDKFEFERFASVISIDELYEADVFAQISKLMEDIEAEYSEIKKLRK